MDNRMPRALAAAIDAVFNAAFGVALDVGLALRGTGPARRMTMLASATTAAVAATLMAVAVPATPAEAAKAAQTRYLVAGIVNGKQRQSDDGGAAETRATMIQCTNSGSKSASLTVEIFNEAGKRKRQQLALLPRTGILIATNREAASEPIGRFINVGEIKAGYGVVRANRRGVICTAQVANEPMDFVYDLPVERLGMAR